MNSVTDRERQIYAKGKLSYILLFGVFLWGVSTALLATAIGAYLERDQDYFAEFLANLPMALLIFPLCGIFWGLMRWKALEKRVQEAD